jgi:hypothetical protein
MCMIQLNIKIKLNKSHLLMEDMVPAEDVSFDKQVLGPIGDALLGCVQQCTVVVLKDSAADSQLAIRGQLQFFDNLAQQ